jgi:hypothetical protein
MSEYPAPLLLFQWGPLRVTDETVICFVFLLYVVLLCWLAFLVLDNTDGVPGDD